MNLQLSPHPASVGRKEEERDKRIRRREVRKEDERQERGGGRGKEGEAAGSEGMREEEDN